MANVDSQDSVTYTIPMDKIQDPINTGENALLAHMRALQSREPQQPINRSYRPENYETGELVGASASDVYTGEYYDAVPEQVGQGQNSNALSQEQQYELLKQLLQPSGKQEAVEAIRSEPGEQPSNPPGYEQFAKDFETYLGIPLQQAIATVNNLQEYQLKNEYQQKVVQVAKEWNVSEQEAMSRMQRVDQRYQSLDEQTKQILAMNPIRGAQLIWQQLEQEDRVSQVSVPNLDRSQVQQRIASKPKGSFTRQELANMTEDEYRQRQQEIIYAYANNLVY